MNEYAQRKLIEYRVCTGRKKHEAFQYLVDNPEVIFELLQDIDNQQIKQQAIDYKILASDGFRPVLVNVLKNAIKSKERSLTEFQKNGAFEALNAVTILDTDPIWGYKGSTMPTGKNLAWECQEMNLQNKKLVRRAIEKHFSLLSKVERYNRQKKEHGEDQYNDEPIELHHLLRCWNHALPTDILSRLAPIFNLRLRMTLDEEDNLRTTGDDPDYAGSDFSSAAYLSNEDLVRDTTMVVGFKNEGHTFGLWAVFNEGKKLPRRFRIYAVEDFKDVLKGVGPNKPEILKNAELSYSFREEKFGPLKAAILEEDNKAGEISVVTGNDIDNTEYSAISGLRKIGNVGGGFGIFAINDRFLDILIPFISVFLRRLKQKNIINLTTNHEVVTRALVESQTAIEKKMNWYDEILPKIHVF